MTKINFLNKKDVYKALTTEFLIHPRPFLSPNIIGMDGPTRVYEFFRNQQWVKIADNLDLKNDSYALELGVSFLPEDIFRYYIPLYIYASLFNKNDLWVFESDFIQQYLCPEYCNHDDFLNFILSFSDAQMSIIAQFISYESEILGFSYACKAYMDFWGDFV